jgi:hypothetical protein
MISIANIVTANDVCNAVKALKPDAEQLARILAVLAENNAIDDEIALAAIREAYDACDTLAGHLDVLAWEADANRVGGY